MGAPVDADVNVVMRRNGEQEAADGPAELAKRTAEVVTELRYRPEEATDARKERAPASITIF